MSGPSRAPGRTLARVGVVCALATALGACAPLTPTPTPTPIPPQPSSAPTSSAGPTTAPTPPSPAASAGGGTGGFDPSALKVRLEPVASGLAAPVGVANASDGSDRLFVVEQAGVIRVIRAGALLETPFLDIRSRIASGGERGLLGLAFAPGYPADPRLFVDYTDLDGNTVISSFRVASSAPDQVDPASERVLLHVDQPFPNHNGGALAFGPDGDLYIGMGDGGSGGDPLGNGQSRTTLLGKILRIRPGAVDGSAPAYTIPPDNPFMTDPTGRPEILAYGLRNPWRFSFDRSTGDLWIGDVGQNAWEEVDVIRAGDPRTPALDFGWNIMEGRHCYGASSCSREGLTLPVAEYGHDQGCAIVGGYVGRDPAELALLGGYLFGDDCSGNIWALDAAQPTRTDPILVLGSGRQISSFGEDEAGRLYLTDLSGGQLLRIVPTS
jgi:glucose/arabinose dehydrogenase